MANVEDFYPLHPDTQEVINKCVDSIPIYVEQYMETLPDKNIIYNQNSYMLFTGLLRYINKNFIKPNNVDVYNIFIADALFNIYAETCYKFNRKPTLLNFSVFIDINTDTLNTWSTGEVKSKLYWEIEDINNTVIDNTNMSNTTNPNTFKDSTYIYNTNKENTVNSNIYNNNTPKDNSYNNSSLNNNVRCNSSKLISRINLWQREHHGGKYRVEPSSLVADTYKKWLKVSEAAIVSGVAEGNSVGCMMLMKSVFGYTEQPQRIEITTNNNAIDTDSILAECQRRLGLPTAAKQIPKK